MPSGPPAPEFIYHACAKSAWRAAEAAGRYEGSADDKRDGFIHFSTADQIVVSCAKHHAGKRDLVLVTVDPGRLGPELKWEPSRSGALFPHLYGSLPVEAVVSVDDLPLGEDGTHAFPVLMR
jgi:uncharacterized protein (DUF952 family)